MAEKKLDQVFFVKKSENVFSQLIETLETNFKFQKILFLGINETDDNFYKFIKKVKCEIVTLKSKSIETVSCIVVFDTECVDLGKELSKCYKIPYYLVMRQFPTTSVFFPFYFIENKIINCFAPSGIIFDMVSLQNCKSDFLLNCSFEMASFKFCVLENSFNEIFFNYKTKYQNEEFSKQLNLLFELFSSNVLNFQQIVETYSKLIEFFVKFEPNSLILMNFLVKNYSCKINPVFCNFLSSQVLFCVYENFIKYYKNGFKTTIDFLSHLKYLNAVGCFNNVCLIDCDYEKAEFVLEKFKQEFVNKINDFKNEFNIAKNFALKTDVNLLYEMSKNSVCNFGYFVCLTADLLHTPSMLKLMLQLGLLNYNF